MASFLKRKNKDGSTSWRVKISIALGNGKYKAQYHTASTYKEAQEIARKLEGTKEELRFGDCELFQDYVEYWYTELTLKQHEYGTYSRYRGIIDNYLIPFFGHYKMTSITYSLCKDFQKSLQKKEKKLSNTSINKITRLLRQVLEYATCGDGRRKQLLTNPINGLECLNEPTKHDFNYWSKEDAELFFSHPLAQADELYYVFLFAINTGMRLGEVAGLEVRKLDFEKKMITISGSLKRRTNSKEKIIGDTKTHRTRRVPMNETIEQLLKKLIKGKKKSDLIFTRRNGFPIDTGHMARHFRLLQESIGVSNVIVFHDLRDTYASHFMMNGGKIYELQHNLGHTTVTMTERYAHFSPDHFQSSRNMVQFKGAL